MSRLFKSVNRGTSYPEQLRTLHRLVRYQSDNKGNIKMIAIEQAVQSMLRTLDPQPMQPQGTLMSNGSHEDSESRQTNWSW